MLKSLVLESKLMFLTSLWSLILLLRLEEIWEKQGASSCTTGEYSLALTDHDPKCFHRCETSTEDMVKMIRTEFENMKEIEKDLDNSVDAEAQMTKETDDLMKEFKEDKIDLDKNWNFA